jgi:hypothetical protein
MSKRIHEENNFAFLVLALVMLMLTGSLTEQFLSGAGQLLLDVLTVLTLIVGVWSITSRPIWFRTGLGLATSIFLIVMAKLVLDWAALQDLHIGIMLLFFVLTAWIAMRQVLFSGPVDGNKLMGAICIFLLFGMIWTMLYLLVAALLPDSFSGLGHGEWQDHFPDLTYFSFVTLTTLGYGDISPALPLVRFLAFMEAIVGQLYIAILVASLVGAHLASRKQKGVGDK